jgi:hypothetical protein
MGTVKIGELDIKDVIPKIIDSLGALSAAIKELREETLPAIDNRIHRLEVYAGEAKPHTPVGVPDRPLFMTTEALEKKAADAVAEKGKAK